MHAIYTGFRFPRRLTLLRQIDLEPSQIVAADIDETPLADELPKTYAERMAREKAQAVAARQAGLPVLAADTVVCCGRRILPKPQNEAAARRCLALLSGRRHRVITAVTLMRGETVREKSVTTMVQFKRLTQAEADAYIASGEWRDKAGGYAIQGLAGAFIAGINGSYTNVVGLPLMEVKVMLETIS